MTAVVSRERARTTYLTAVAGMLLLAVAVVMMVVAAPVHLQARPHGPAKPSAVELVTDECHQLTSRSAPAVADGCPAWPNPPAALSAS